MRKSRGKYKRSGRLGYNVILRRWNGKKKKWNGHILGQNKEEKSRNEVQDMNGVNPVVALKNEDIVGGIKGLKEGHMSMRLRRKDIHGIQQNQKTGRKRRYGGIVGKTIKKNRSEQRKAYKEWKRISDRNYRNGRLISEYQKVVETTSLLKKQEPEAHRITRLERRADVRRWRSGRVPTLQIARDLIEHNYVSYIKANVHYVHNETVKWQGYQVQVGCGRKVQEEVWCNIKENIRKLIKHNEYNVTAAKYREVDYVTGRRVVLRLPESGEVVIPTGREVSLSTYM